MNQISKAASILGKKGGISGTGQAKARTTEQCKLAAKARWGTLEERFWKKVNKNAPNGCWEWTAAKHDSKHKYGIFGIGGPKVTRAHRFSWELKNGPIPDNLDVLHKCDNPPCVNPSHLFLGTPKINGLDAAHKGRTKQGINHWNAKLKEKQVKMIRSLYKKGKHNHKQIANQFGVSIMTVWRIFYGWTWKHILTSSRCSLFPILPNQMDKTK